MLKSSLGFHTMTLTLSLLTDEARQLLIDFSTYRKNTKLIEMYTKNESGEPIIYYYKYPLMPLKVDIYFIDRYRGISWCIRASKKPSVPLEYIVEVTINPKFLAGISDYLTAATYNDMNCAIANFNNESKKISPLLYQFKDYKIDRIDYCINISLDEFIPGYNSDQILNLIKRSNIPPHYEEWKVYDKTAHRMISKPESFYLISKSVNINYYSKYLQLLNKSEENVKKKLKPIDQETIDASRDIYRFEVQCKYHKIYSLSQKTDKEGNPDYNKYKNLLDPVTCIKIVSDYYKRTIGKGDWYSLSEAEKIIKSQNYNCQREQKLINALKFVSQCRSLSNAKKNCPEKILKKFENTLDELSDLNINPVTIPREWNIKHIHNLLRSYFDKLPMAYYENDLKNMAMHSCTFRGYQNYREIFGHSPI